MGKTANRKGNLPAAAVAIGAAGLGWFLKRSISKRQQREEHRPITEKIRRFERKLYEDGQKRANELGDIKQEIHKKVSE
ncbi:hypothetical protein [Virgibacillus ainsalahensis]